MKKNKMMRLAAIVMMLTLLTTCAISGTFAKYVTKASASDTARVAKWDITYNNDNLEDTITFDLFNTMKDNDGTTNESETDVAKSTSDIAIIAPGTSGSFEIKLKNDSEVAAKYTVALSAVETGGDIPIEYALSNDTDTTWTSDISTLTQTNSRFEMDEEATITVYWRWVFENGTDTTLETNDGNDTTLGLAGTATVTVTANITVTQID
ncbi:MAG: hypothetical protein IJW55_00245 [Clostridia bacterium]|nr:hypothetical protein [Clostridia bacterium]